MNLIEYREQNTLPEQVSVNKENIELLSDAIDKLGYTPRGEYDATVEYNYNDVVFYDYKLYAMIKEDGVVVGVLPTNTEYWQAVTGNIRGQQGAQGAQGQPGADGTDGADGADGADTLWYKNNILVSTLEQFTALLNEASHSFSTAYFNRTPKVGDNFMVFVYLSSARETYWLQYQVSAVSGGSTTAVYQNSYAKLTGAQGEKGDTGEMALVYGQVYHKSQTLVENQDIVLSDLNLIVADFNRAPKADDQFVLLYFDTYAQKLYIGYAEVEGINSSTGAVTTVLYRDMHIVTGADGQNGTNGTDGTDGVDALVCSEIYGFGSYPTVGQTIYLTNTSLNREALVNDNCIVIGATTSKSMICMVKVLSIDNTYTRVQITAVVETTGASGQGSGLTKTTYNYDATALTSSSNWLTMINAVQDCVVAKIQVNDTGQGLLTGYAWGEEQEISGTTYKFLKSKMINGQFVSRNVAFAVVGSTYMGINSNYNGGDNIDYDPSNLGTLTAIKLEVWN